MVIVFETLANHYFQLRNLARRICNSPTIRADLKLACEKAKIEPKLMIRDVATRWNSTIAMINRALELQEALSILVSMESHNQPHTAQLQRFQLSRQEWFFLKQIKPLLDVSFILLKDLTLIFF